MYEDIISIVPEKVKELITVVNELEEAFPGRHFTLDGHLVGSIGEVLASYYYGVDLYTASEAIHDGKVNGREVQIKITQHERVIIAEEPDYLIVLYLTNQGDAYEIYNGRGDGVWDSASNPPSHKYRHISISKLMKLDTDVRTEDRITAIHEIPKMKPEYRNKRKKA